MFGIAEGRNRMTHRVSDREPETVMRSFLELQRTTHLEIAAVPQADERDIIESVGISFAELIRPNNQCIVEERAGTRGLRCFGETPGEKGQFFREPGIDLNELLLRLL